MSPSQASPEAVGSIRAFAKGGQAVVGRDAKWGLMSWSLTTADICAAIVAHIDAGERVKPTTIHSFPGHVGEPAYEMKPRIDGVLFYVKVRIIELEDAQRQLLVMSVHPDN